MSTRVKSREVIARIRALYRRKMAIKKIVRTTGVSINTVRKIVRRASGYEKGAFVRKARRPYFRANPINSEIDGELLYAQRSAQGQKYQRVSTSEGRVLLHVHEAKKAYKLCNKPWPKLACVHHVDGDPANNTISNLIVFDNTSAHMTFHGQQAQAMYQFLTEHNLLNQFKQETDIKQPPTLRQLLQPTPAEQGRSGPGTGQETALPLLHRNDARPPGKTEP